MAPAYSGTYTLTSLGSVSGLPTNYGGLVFKDANTIWIGGAANTAPGRFYAVTVTRGAGNHVTALGTPTVLGFGIHNDGAVAFSPSGVLFYAEYSNNSIGQVISPFASDYSTTALTGLGVTSSVGGGEFCSGRIQRCRAV